MPDTMMTNFLQALNIMVLGMAGIFLFMGVFYIVIYALELLFRDRKQP